MDEKKEISKENKGLLQEIYKTRWRTYRNELKHCQTDPTEEAVHELRIATRRLLALIDLLRNIAPNTRLQKLRQALKKQFDELNDLRDTQVMLVETSESLDELPEVAPFQRYLNKRERRLLRSTVKAIKTFKYSGIRKQMDTVRKKTRKKISPDLLLHAVDERFETVIRRYQHIDQANISTIHRMRIAFKKFRYMVEIVHPWIPGFPENNFEFMHGYQGMMGDIQDLEVFLSTFEDFADRDASYDPKLVLRYYQQRHEEAVTAFIEDMHQIHAFWRPTPESAFPWETGQQLDDSVSNDKIIESPSGQEGDKSGK